jgi:hypothetical protein
VQKSSAKLRISKRNPLVSSTNKKCKKKVKFKKPFSNTIKISYCTAKKQISKLKVKKSYNSGYRRNLFMSSWKAVGNIKLKGGAYCSNGNMRSYILNRDSLEPVSANNYCTISKGKWKSPYNGRIYSNAYGGTVQIDHIVSLSNAWKSGAYKWSSNKRHKYAMDKELLLSVDGESNMKKSDGSIDEWSPGLKKSICPYAINQIQVKYKYGLFVTSSEKSSLKNALKRC